MRPEIICHMMSSVDGRLDCDRYTSSFDGKTFDEVSEIYFEISNRYDADAIMIGRKTVQKHYFHRYFSSRTSTAVKSLDSYKGNLKSKRYTIIADPKGKIFYESDTADGENIIAVLGETVSAEYLDHLKVTGISYVFAGPAGSDMKLALETLKKEFGINKILLEGGGYINGAFLKAGLIDQLSLMIYPGIDGLAGTSTIFDYCGIADELPAKNQKLEFKAAEVLNDGIVWLTYKIHGANG